MSKTAGLRIAWAGNVLSIRDERLAVPHINVTYLEAFCRAQSQDRVWDETVIPHETRLVSADEGGTRVCLESRIADGTSVSHVVTAGKDEVTFELTAHNPTRQESHVHWAQPCIRVGAFTGLGDDSVGRYEYLKRCFLFVEGQLARMPLPVWNTVARYMPGQVWCPRHVPRTDVNPRPLSTVVPSNGLIGCFSGDERMILATAWAPYQELFQGIIQCIHSDFRIGGLKAGETKTIRGRIYMVENDVPALLKRYAGDFPEQG